MLGPGVANALAAVTPGWECIPATAGHAVVSGGTGGFTVVRVGIDGGVGADVCVGGCGW